MPRRITGKKKKSGNSSSKQQSLSEKASSSIRGYALLDDDEDNSVRISNGNGRDANGRKRQRKCNSISKSQKIAKTPAPIQRTFRNITNEGNPASIAVDKNNDNDNGNGNDSRMHIIATPAYIRRNRTDEQHQTNTTSSNNHQSVSKTPLNPYNNNSNNSNNNNNNANSNLQSSRFKPPPSAKHQPYSDHHSHSSTHIIASISENVAKETCITIMDAGSPVSMQIHKMTNGATYAESVAFLKSIEPHEILLNEGRKNSPLCQKIMNTFAHQHGAESNLVIAQEEEQQQQSEPGAKVTADLTGACQTKTVVKFLPRSYFDQHRGAQLLQRIARPHSNSNSDSHDSFTNEYIFASAAYATCQYMQVCLGADFAPNSLQLSCPQGGSNRMAMDRGTIQHLELIVNAKTNKKKHSLIGTIDSTKTSVGGRLLRMNIVAPPTSKDTIDARLDLVDSFLEDEVFFYEVMEQLTALPDLHRMLAPMALVPKKSCKGGGKVTAKMASKGIGALVCIKSTLSLIPDFARVLEIQLKDLMKRKEKRNTNTNGNVERDDGNDDCSMEGSSKSHQCSRGEGVMDDDGDNSDSDSQEGDVEQGSDASSSENGIRKPHAGKSIQTSEGSLLLGLGSGPVSSVGKDTPSQAGHQLLRAILIAMKNPELQEILDAVMEIFTESTTYSKNSHAMRHQECFALKPNTDGMMVSLGVSNIMHALEFDLSNAMVI